MRGVLAQKIGMTRVVCPDTGKLTAVTLLRVEDNGVVQVKTADRDGYDAVVLGTGERKNFGKNENKKFKFIHEFKYAEEGIKRGDVVTAENLEENQDVKITGVSKGRGFTGVIKKYNFQRGRETHGSHHHREPGSVGMCAKPGRIMKGKKLPGRHGTDQVTFSTKIVTLDLDNGLVAVRGGVPGAKKGYVVITEK
jgi:large subunit ribosomal protein L3